MTKLALALPLALLLSSCAVLDTQVATPQQAYVAAEAYNAGVVAGTAYLRLPECPKATICRTQELSQRVYGALKAARPARAAIVTALKAHKSAPITALQTLQAAYAVLQQLPQQ